MDISAEIFFYVSSRETFPASRLNSVHGCRDVEKARNVKIQKRDGKQKTEQKNCKMQKQKTKRIEKLRRLECQNE